MLKLENTWISTDFAKILPEQYCNKYQSVCALGTGQEVMKVP